MKPLFIGTRGSRLALWQAEYVKDLLAKVRPEQPIELRIFTTRGDKVLDKALPEIGGKGLFTKELETSLLKDEIQLAVHSLKDLPSTLPAGLAITGTPEREDPRDALVSLTFPTFDALPDRPIMATGSVRRQAQILSARPAARFENLRGNIETRLKKLETRGWDGIIMAAAALIRLNMTERITEHLDPLRYVPSVGQGAIAIEINTDREDVRELVSQINHPDTFLAITAERAFMRKLEGGCSVPLGAWARLENGRLVLTGYFSDLNGNHPIIETISGPLDDPGALGLALADKFESLGFRDLIPA